MVYSTRPFVLCLALCFFRSFGVAVASHGGGGGGSRSWCFRTFVRFVLVWICRFPLPLSVWEGLRFLIVALPGLFSYIFFTYLAWSDNIKKDTTRPKRNYFYSHPETF